MVGLRTVVRWKDNRPLTSTTTKQLPLPALTARVYHRAFCLLDSSTHFKRLAWRRACYRYAGACARAGAGCRPPGVAGMVGMPGAGTVTLKRTGNGKPLTPLLHYGGLLRRVGRASAALRWRRRQSYCPLWRINVASVPDALRMARTRAYNSASARKGTPALPRRHCRAATLCYPTAFSRCLLSSPVLPRYYAKHFARPLYSRPRRISFSAFTGCSAVFTPRHVRRSLDYCYPTRVDRWPATRVPSSLGDILLA